jgi:quinol monooxygenase YgiN
MLVVNRYRVAAAEADEFDAAARRALAALAGRPGFVAGQVGRNVDDPDLWVMTTRWESVGAYRRALSAYDVKLHAVPLMYRAIDEPSAFEVLLEDTGAGVATFSSDRAPDSLERPGRS